MPDAKAIQETLTNEYNEFMRKPFPSPLPEWLVEKFKDALMSMPQAAVPYYAGRIQQILVQKPEELTIFDIGIVSKIFLSVRPEVFGWGIEEFLMKRTEVEKVSAEHLELVQQEEARLQKKKMALENMGGQMKNNNHNLTKA